MKRRSLVTAAAAAVLAMAPIAAQAQPLRAGAELVEANDQVGSTEVAVGVAFFLGVVALAIFATGEDRTTP